MNDEVGPILSAIVADNIPGGGGGNLTVIKIIQFALFLTARSGSRKGERKRVGEGKRVVGRCDVGGGRIL